jgi:co-chaperonin GroES (HSP10)
MTPLGNRVFIRPDIEDQVGLIWRARMSRQMPDKGTITAISAKAANDTGLKVGDRVFFSKHHQQLSEDEKSTMIDAGDILAILE